MKLPSRRRISLCCSLLLLVTLPAACRAAQGPLIADGLPLPSRSADGPLFLVGDKSYTLKDLIGVTEAQLRQRFQSYIKDMDDKELIRYMTDQDRAEVGRAAPIQRRSLMEEFAFRSYQHPLLRHAIEMILVAGITENILRDQGIDANDYFDLELLRASRRKESRYINILYTDPDRQDKDDALLEKLNETLGIHYDKARWRKTRAGVRVLGPLRRLEIEFCRRSPHFEESSVKTILAHALLEQVCAKGSYYHKARRLAILHESAFDVYEIIGYSGDKAALEAFLRSVTKDGFILERGVERLLDTLKVASPSVSFRTSVKAGWDVVAERLPIGVLTELEPSRYRILGWHMRYDPEGVNATGKTVFDLTVKKYAYDLAARDYYPEVRLYSKLVPHIPSSVIGSLRNDGLLIAGAEMHRGNYVKKPYPAELFDACREAKSKRETFAVRAALAVAANDKKAAQQLVSQLTAESKKPAPEAIQERFREMAERLAKEFKLDKAAAP